MNIRPETLEDTSAIRAVVAAAFGRETEADLVESIRARGESLVSLAAEDHGRIIGHVLVSPITLSESAGAFGGVAPLSVHPEFQGKGTGSLLMHAALDRCRSLDLDALFLLGAPEFYQRFGFRTSHIANEYGASTAFMHLELKPAALAEVSGTAKYVAAFAEVGA